MNPNKGEGSTPPALFGFKMDPDKDASSWKTMELVKALHTIKGIAHHQQKPSKTFFTLDNLGFENALARRLGTFVVQEGCYVSIVSKCVLPALYHRQQVFCSLRASYGKDELPCPSQCNRDRIVVCIRAARILLTWSGLKMIEADRELHRDTPKTIKNVKYTTPN